MSISDLHPQPSPAAVLARRGVDGPGSGCDVVDEPDRRRPGRRGRAARAAAARWPRPSRPVRSPRPTPATSAKPKLHYGSTGDWLTHLGGLRKGEGRRVVARAHALTGPLEATREAMAAGTVSPEQADVIVKSVDALPSGTGGPEPAVKPPCSSMPGASTPPTSPAPDVTWSMWSTPTPWTGSSSGSWTGRNAPPTWADTSRSRPTVPAASGSRAAAPPRTAPSSKQRSCRSPHPRRRSTNTTVSWSTTRAMPGARMWDALVQTAPARPGHRPATRLPRRTRPAHGHHHPRVTA